MHNKPNPVRQFYISIILSSFCFLFAGISKAQNIAARIIDLPGSFNRDFVQFARDDEGFIWFSNNEGIWRFDGTDIKLFDYKKLNLPQNTATPVLYCYHHFLFSNINQKLRIYDEVTDKCYMYDMKGSIFNIDTTRNGEVLFFTQDGQSWKFTGDKLLRKGINAAVLKGWQKGMELQKAVPDADGSLYLFLRGRIGHIVHDSIRWSEPDAPSTKGEIPLNIVYSVALTKRYIAVHYYNGQVIIYDKQTFAVLYRYMGKQFAFALTMNDKIVLITHEASIKADYQPTPLFLVENNIFPDFFKVRSAIYIKETNKYLVATSLGIVELGVHNKVADRYGDQKKLVNFFRNKSVRSIYRKNTSLYVGTYNGFYECRPDTIRMISSTIIYTMNKLNDSMLLAGVEGGYGFALINTNTGTYADLPVQDRRHSIYTFSLYPDAGQWLAGGNDTLRSLSQATGNWTASAILGDSTLGAIRQVKRINGKLFITSQRGVYAVNGEGVLQKIYPANELLRVYCMLDAGDGIWLGTHGEGLVKIDATGRVLQQIGFNEGLAGNFVYTLTIMKNLLVAGTSNGISVFNTASDMEPLPVQKNDSLLGLYDQEFNGSAAFYDSSSQQVILGGVKGLSFVDARDYSTVPGFKNNSLILSYIKTGVYENTSANANLFAYETGDITLKPADVYVTLKFASPGNAGETEGLFRIQGLNDKWQRVKIDQEVNLYALPPGSYTLQARLPSAVNSSEWFTKTIVVLPAFYQTVLFKVLLFACLLGIIYFFWRSKVKKIEREHQLRTTIASDLHDDIGSTLNSISVYTVVAGQQLEAGNGKTKMLLDNMGIASRGMIDRMNDIVWAINPKNDDFENVLERMQFFAAELLSGKNMLLKFEVDEKIKKLKFTMQERKNIYLIYKEAVNNAFKYSGGKTVAVRMFKQGGELEMIIADDGAGFNGVVKTAGGNGLTNMKNRAKEIGGRLIITSVPAHGTTVNLQMRLR